MDQMIKIDKIDFKMLVEKDSKSSLNFQSKMTQRLSETFTEEQQRWYVAILYLYLNTDPKDFPINLENVYSLIGFAHKKNARRTLENNFTVNEDYKEVLLPREQNSKGGRPEEEIWLNVETFKGMCMMSKTEKGKEIRKYYNKLENILNEILIEERLEYQEKLKIEQDKINQQKLLINQQYIQNIELTNAVEEKDAKLANLTRKVTEHGPGKAVYVYETIFQDVKVKKVGKAIDRNVRITNQRTTNPDIKILYSTRCQNHSLFEKACHFLLDKWRVSNKREFFDCSLDIIKNVMNYTKLVLESNIDFETINLYDIKEFFDTVKEYPNSDEEFSNSDSDESDQENEQIMPLLPVLDAQIKDCNNFALFVQDCCDIKNDGNDENNDDNDIFECSYAHIQSQYKIWGKTSNKEQINKLLEYLKPNFNTIKKKEINTYKPKKEFFIGIKLKSKFYEFVNGDSIIENFLFEKCNRGPTLRITKKDLLDNFEDFENSDIVKKNIINYFDIYFLRDKMGDTTPNKDLRQPGYLGVELKITVKKIRKNKVNSKKVYQIQVSTKKVLREFESQRDAAKFMNVSPSLMYINIKTKKQKDDCIFSFTKDIIDM